MEFNRREIKFNTKRWILENPKKFILRIGIYLIYYLFMLSSLVGMPTEINENATSLPYGNIFQLLVLAFVIGPLLVETTFRTIEQLRFSYFKEGNIGDLVWAKNFSYYFRIVLANIIKSFYLFLMAIIPISLIFISMFILTKNTPEIQNNYSIPVTLFFLSLSFLVIVLIGILSISWSQSTIIYMDNLQSENPIGIHESLSKSRKLMNGNKFDYFKLGLSFIGWVAIGSFVLGIFTQLVSQGSDLSLIGVPVGLVLICYLSFVYGYLSMVTAAFYLHINEELPDEPFRNVFKEETSIEPGCSWNSEDELKTDVEDVLDPSKDV